MKVMAGLLQYIITIAVPMVAHGPLSSLRLRPVIDSHNAPKGGEVPGMA